MTSATTATPRESQPWFAAIFDVACGTQTLFGIQASMESARADSCHAHENLSMFPVACHTLTEARLGWQSEEEESRVAELQSSRWGSADLTWSFGLGGFKFDTQTWPQSQSGPRVARSSRSSTGCLLRIPGYCM